MATATKPPMRPMRITLSRPIEKYVRARAKEERYSKASDYVDDLIRDDQEKREARARLEELLLEGINSGPGVVMGSKEWKRFRKDIISRVKSQKQRHDKNSASRFPKES